MNFEVKLAENIAIGGMALVAYWLLLTALLELL